jgi:hypothetical protein
LKKGRQSSPGLPNTVNTPHYQLSNSHCPTYLRNLLVLNAQEVLLENVGIVSTH